MSATTTIRFSFVVEHTEDSIPEVTERLKADGKQFAEALVQAVAKVEGVRSIRPKVTAFKTENVKITGTRETRV